MSVSEARPRWGTFSVKSHLDLDALTLDVLLYDALVFPTPSDAGEADRWDGEGWDTALLAQRIVQLGDLAYAAPWGERLRALWKDLFDRRAREHPNDPTLAFDLTAQIMANEYFVNLVGPDDDELAVQAPGQALVKQDAHGRRAPPWPARGPRQPAPG
jgi:hypothetical protein